ncbi:MAG: extracellular solute-binding protein [Ruminococcaceae bacterium]|nr:extracellular solute-binding protein [Oscillospiraceae bacterium]
MKKRIYKIFTAVLSLLLAMTMLAGCSSDSDKDKDSIKPSAKPEPENLVGQITFSGYITDANDSHIEDYISAFNSQYNNVEVNVIHDDFMDSYFAELDSRIEDGLIGDVFLIDAERMAKYAAQGKILDLSPYVKNYMDFDTYETINPAEELFEAAYEASIYNGKMYMGATEYYHNFVFVNYSLLEKAGLAVPGDNWTWTELKADATAIKEKAGIKTPIVMDYTDYDVWGAFARSFGSDIYDNIGNTDTKGLNLTHPDVISGFEYLANEIVSSGLVLKDTADSIKAEDLSKYAFIVADHTNLVQWNEYLTSDKCDFDWDYMHFPRWEGEKVTEVVTEETQTPTEPVGTVREIQTYNQSIGAKTYGLAVYVHDDDEHTQEHYDMCAQLALYGLVDNGAEGYVGNGETVPANKAIAAKRFWRDYPVSGKNSSVFTHYADRIVLINSEEGATSNIADFPATLTSFMSIDAAAEINVQKLLDDYIKNKVPFEDSLQKAQDNANKKW